MGKILISKKIIDDKIEELKNQLVTSHSDLNKISINSKIETLNWLMDEFNHQDLETITFKELRIKYVSNSRDTMSRWIESAYPEGLIIKKDDKL